MRQEPLAGILGNKMRVNGATFRNGFLSGCLLVFSIGLVISLAMNLRLHYSDQQRCLAYQRVWALIEASPHTPRLLGDENLGLTEARRRCSRIEKIGVIADGVSGGFVYAVSCNGDRFGLNYWDRGGEHGEMIKLLPWPETVANEFALVCRANMK